jgi:hypothetical protein
MVFQNFASIASALFASGGVALFASFRNTTRAPRLGLPRHRPADLRGRPISPDRAQSGS